MDPESCRLSDQQIEQFETFGVLVRRQVFTPDEMARITGEFEDRLETLRAEANTGDEPRFHNWPNRNPQTPFIAGLLEDPRIYLPGEQLAGEDSVPVLSNANSYRSSTPWHPDIHDHDLYFIKNVMYLQPTIADRGALRFIPGSHRNPFHDALLNLKIDGTDDNEATHFTQSGLRPEDLPCYIFESNPGDVVIFNARTWHAAFGGYEDRRTCTFNFVRNPKTPEAEKAMRRQVGNARKVTEFLETVGPQYHPSWLENPEGSARRARWIEWLEKWGFVEAYQRG